MKKVISITVNKDNLVKFDKMLEEKMIPRSWFFDQMMKNELETWENKR